MSGLWKVAKRFKASDASNPMLWSWEYSLEEQGEESEDFELDDADFSSEIVDAF